MHKETKRLWLGLALAAGMLLPGCVSMKAVQDYAVASHKTLEGVQSVAKDYSASCLRANRYRPLSEHSKCVDEKAAAKGLQSAAAVLDAYVVALGALAADDLVHYDTEIGALAGEVKKSGIITNSAQVDAFASLAAFIAKAATSAYQQKQVAKYVTLADAAVGTASKALADAISTNYPARIDNELVFWTQSYTRVETAERIKHPLDWEAYASTQWQVRTDLEAKAAAAMALTKSVDAIGKTHAELKKDAEHLSGKELLAAVSSFVATAQPVLKDVQEAFAHK